MIPSIDRTISVRYEQQINDVRDWLSKTVWGQKQVTKEDVMKVQNRLKSLDLIAEIKSSEHFLMS